MFVAAYPPLESAAQMVSSAESAVRAGGDNSAWRLTPVEQVHLTLLFLGEVAPRELDDVEESIRCASSGMSGFELQPTGVVTLPERGEARVLAVATDLPSRLRELQKRLASRLARARERGRFMPHFTVARGVNGVRAARVEADAEIGAFRIGEVKLMRSELRPGGAVHAVQRVFPLS